MVNSEFAAIVTGRPSEARSPMAVREWARAVALVTVRESWSVASAGFRTVSECGRVLSRVSWMEAVSPAVREGAAVPAAVVGLPEAEVLL